MLNLRPKLYKLKSLEETEWLKGSNKFHWSLMGNIDRTKNKNKKQANKKT